VWGRSGSFACPAGAHGPYRAGSSGQPHLVYPGNAEPHGAVARPLGRELQDLLNFMKYVVLDVDEEARQSAILRVQAELEQLKDGSHPSQRPLRAVPVQGHMLEDATHLAVPVQEHVLEDATLLLPLPLGASGGAATMQALTYDQLALDSSLESWDGLDLAVEETVNAAERKSVLQQVARDLPKLTCGSLLEVDRYKALRAECLEVFDMETGAEALEELLAALDLAELARSLRETIRNGEESQRARAIKRLKVVEAFHRSGIDPQRMILRVIPVLPPDLRPVLQMEGGRFASTDITSSIVVSSRANNRLKQLQKLNAFDSMINQEKRALQMACDALLDNKRCERPLLGGRKRL